MTTEIDVATGLYTTHYEDGTPVQKDTWLNPELPSRPGPNILTLLMLMQQSKIMTPAALAGMLPIKWSPDILVDMYSRASKRIVYDSPSFSTGERIQQAIRENLRQKVRNATGVAIPGTTEPNVSDFVPFMQQGDENLLKNFIEMVDQDDRSNELDTANPNNKDRMQSVGSATSAWLNKVKTTLFTHKYRRQPDIRVADTLIIEYGPRTGVKNPQLYPKIAFICSTNGAFIFDIFINTEKQEVFSYGSQLPHQITAPPSLLADPFLGMLTQAEYSQYLRGLALAYLKIRDAVNIARTEDKRTKTLKDVAK
jgi:hypothetical protein